MEIRGAAIATFLSNCIAMLYFVRFILARGDETVITFDLSQFTLKHRIPNEVILVGLPGFLLTCMSSISNTFLNSMVASYSTQAIAGMGIAKKINLLAFAIAQGTTQGTLPLIAYNYSSGNRKRMNDAIKTSFLYSFLIAVIGTLFTFFFSVHIIQLFIRDQQTVSFGESFLRIICLACPTTSINFMFITILQAVGEKAKPIFVSFLRKGTIDVILMIVLSNVIGIRGIAWATPLADWLALLIGIIVFIPVIKKINTQMQIGITMKKE